MSEQANDELDRSDMQRLASGHDAALNDLMERHALRLFHYVLRHLPSEDDANDLTQETFVKVYLNREKFRTDAKFSSWLYTIAINLIRDKLRWQHRHPTISLQRENEQGEGAGLADVLPSTVASPSEEASSAERAAIVQRAIAVLPEDMRLPLILSEYEGKSQAEIATILNCSTKAIEMRLYRARQFLREKLTWVRDEISFN
jgi:RNA polymerase sigma-70 factor (ECF subfamily)